MRRRLVRLAAPGLLLALAAGVTEAGVDPGLEARRRAGQERLEEFDYAAALSAFGVVVKAYRDGSLDPWDPEGLTLLKAAFEGRAVAHLGAGDLEAVRTDLAEALEAHPGFAPDRERSSPRLLEIFDEIRDRTLGRVTVRTVPDGTAVWIDDRRVGEAPLEDLPWYAGTVRLRLELPGHEPVAAEVVLAPGAPLTVERRMVPNARTVILRTAPAGVVVFLDGQRRGTATGPASAEAAARQGLPSEPPSRDVVLEHVSPGLHRLRVERPCYRALETTIDVQLDPENNRPLRSAPLILEPSVARLEIRSTPSGAFVRVDGRDAGRTPIALPAVCTGRRTVQLEAEPRGRWAGTVELRPGEERRLDVLLRPTLVFAGVRRGPGAGRAVAHAAAVRIGETLDELDRYHVLRVDEGAGPPTARLPELLESHDADLLLAAEVRLGQVRPVLELVLGSRDLPGARSVTVPADDPAALRSVLGALGASAEVQRPWLGLLALDGPEQEGPIVVRLHPQGPAKLAGVLFGDRLVALEGRPLTTVADIATFLERRDPAGPKDVALVVRRADGEHSLWVQVGSTPLLVPGGTAWSDPALLVELQYLADREPDEGVRAIAQLNRALVFLRLERPDLALRHALPGADLPAGSGISAGTVSYLRGLCFERLGEEFKWDARRAFEAAAGAAGATLHDHDGPAVAPLARLHLEALR